MSNKLEEIIYKTVNENIESAGAFGDVLMIISEELLGDNFLEEWFSIEPKRDLETEIDELAKDIEMLRQEIGPMVDRKVLIAVGQSSFERIKAHLVGLADAFKGYIQVVDPEERKVRLAYILTLADVAMGEVEAISAPYLHLIVKPFKVVALLHIAVLKNQVSLHPEHYENQLALNKAAIRYSNLAKSFRNKFEKYRMGKIAQGNGIVTYTLINSSEGETVKAQDLQAYDYAYGWETGTIGKKNTIVYTQVPFAYRTQWNNTPELLQAREKVNKYIKREKELLETWWTSNLTSITAMFMELVDWEGEPKFIDGSGKTIVKDEWGIFRFIDSSGNLIFDAPAPANPIIVEPKRKPINRFALSPFPKIEFLPGITGVTNSISKLERLDIFLGQQMDQFTLSGPRYVQTYRVSEAANSKMLLRADTYDTAVTAIYFSMRGDLKRACDLVDGLCTALEHDSKGDGRIVAATNSSGLLDENNNYNTSVFYPEGGRYDIGNMSWAGIAMTRLYAKTKKARYLYNAAIIGDWIIKHCTSHGALSGYTGGEDENGKRKWLSVEHNIDAYILFQNLSVLTSSDRWLDSAEHAQHFVKACQTSEGCYAAGSAEGNVVNKGVIPTDTQSWTSLSNLNKVGNSESLQYMLDYQQTETGRHVGFKFSTSGSGVQNEVTAGAAMALHLAGGKFKKEAEAFYESLLNQQDVSADAMGVPATPGETAYTGEGLGWSYYKWLHVASSAWTGLALLARQDKYANPYEVVKMED